MRVVVQNLEELIIVNYIKFAIANCSSFLSWIPGQTTGATIAMQFNKDQLCSVNLFKHYLAIDNAALSITLLPLENSESIGIEFSEKCHRLLKKLDFGW